MNVGFHDMDICPVESEVIERKSINLKDLSSLLSPRTFFCNFTCTLVKRYLALITASTIPPTQA